MKTCIKSNDWLGLFLWTLDILMNPNSCTLLDSFESWNYRNHLSLDLKQLRRSRLVECQGTHGKSQWRLTGPPSPEIIPSTNQVAAWFSLQFAHQAVTNLG